jgi:hypothetical protein
MTMQTTDDIPAKPRKAPAACCSVEGCGMKSYARGLCIKHYYRVRRTGSTARSGARQTTGPKILKRRERMRQEYARNRERRRNGQIALMVVINVNVVNMLIRGGWLLEKDVIDMTKIAAATSRMLEVSAG